MQKLESKTTQKYSFRFEAIGTHWQINMISSHSDKEILEIQTAISKRIDKFDQAYSRFRSDSFVTSISKKPGIYKLPADAQPMFDFYEQLYKATDGKITPLIGETLSNAGYDANYSFQQKRLNVVMPWHEIIDYDFPILKLKRPALLDLGAAGKGYLIDIIAEILKLKGISCFSINGGGDIYNYKADPSLAKIGLENPDHTDEIVGIATIKTGSICASAGNRRAWGSYSHIIDPVKLTSPKSIKSSWVKAKSCLVADGVATALFFTKPNLLRKFFNFDYAIINSNGSLVYSSGFSSDFFSQDLAA